MNTIKKLGLVFLTLFIIMSSVNAVTELTSCGKSSGWVSGETYLINFTEIPITYTNEYCFELDANGLNNIEFLGTGKPINMNSAETRWFINVLPDADNINGVYRDIHLNTHNAVWNGFIYQKTDSSHQPASTNDFRYSNFYNITMDSTNGVQGYLLYNFVYGYSSGADFQYWDYSNFTNVNLINHYFVYQSAISFMSGAYQGNRMSNIVIDNMFINNPKTNTFLLGQLSINRGVGTISSIFTNWEIKNSVFIGNTTEPIKYTITGSTMTNGGHTVTNTLISDKIYNDSGDNNIGDISPFFWDITNYFTISNPSIYTIFRGDYYIQDVKEAFDLIDDITDKIVYPINDDYSTYLNPIHFDNTGGGNTYNCNFMSLLEMERQSIQLRYNNNLQNCNLVSSSILTGLNYEYGDISFNSGMNIINNSITKTGTQDTVLIKDEYLATTIYTNIDSNIFKITSSGLTDMKFIESNAQFSNRIVYNSFDVLGDSVVYYMSFLSNTDSFITRNTFGNSFSYSTTYLFKDNGISTSNINFFNNKISDDLGVKIGDNSVSLDYYYGYEHTDNKIYFFNLGNYYTGNTGCIDIGGDGICDSSYTFDGVVDNYPLSVYPFDFISHLITADFVIDNEAFNMTFVNVIENETINLATLSDTIIVDYQHTSNFLDIQCDYYVNTVNVITEFNVPNTLQNVSYNSWLEGANSLFINCYNGFQSATTGILNINIVVPDGDVYGCTDSQANNYNILATIDDGSCTYDAIGNNESAYESVEIIGETTSETSDNLISWFGDISGGVISIAQTIGIFLFVILIIGGLVNLIS